MNNTTTIFSPNDDNHMRSFTYGIVFTIAMVIFITIFLMACVRLRIPLAVLLSRWGPQPAIAEATSTTDGGIDDKILESYPKLLYLQLREYSTTSSSPLVISCSICLDDYKDSDVLRKLPDCGHLYHLVCIDSWLKSHPTCPLCRTSPSPVRPEEEREVAVRVE